MADQFIDWASLGTDDLSGDSRKGGAPRQTFPCAECAGTGQYRGVRVHQPKAHCFACGGKGHFLTSYADRVKAQAQREASKGKAVQRVQAAVEQTAGGLVEWMRANSDWCNLAASCLEQMAKGKDLSPRQIEVLNGIRAKQAQRREEKAAARTTDLGGGAGLDVLRSLIAGAKERGKTHPTYRALGLTISEAPASGRNVGALYVKSTDGGVYLGKIVDGRFVANRDGEQAGAGVLLRQIAADPKGEAIRYGTKIGKCFCCGAKLTAKVSLDRGIGPVCWEKWGF
jgi:hypothetical protein